MRTTISSKSQPKSGLGLASSDVGGNRRTELVRPPADDLVTPIDPALGEKVLDVAKARRKPKIEPDHQADCIGREAMTLVGYGLHAHPSTHQKSSCGGELALD